MPLQMGVSGFIFLASVEKAHDANGLPDADSALLHISQHANKGDALDIFLRWYRPT